MKIFLTYITHYVQRCYDLKDLAPHGALITPFPCQWSIPLIGLWLVITNFAYFGDLAGVLAGMFLLFFFAVN
jgi:hypothetical protein